MTAPDGARYEALKVTAVHGDLSQEIVQITVDKLRIILNTHSERVGASKEWYAPAGVMFTLIATGATTDFREWLGISAERWGAFFMLIGAATAIWLIRGILRSRRALTVAALVACIKTGLTE